MTKVINVCLWNIRLIQHFKWLYIYVRCYISRIINKQILIEQTERDDVTQTKLN